MAALGHRRVLLDAIAALRTDAGNKAPVADVATTTGAQSTPEDRAERRQVTVMFSDLVGSTALSARMDPEDLREVISAYQKCVAENVGRFGGFVAKYMGDGVLIYFGYPQAHEDDAERAVRAGLELVAAVSDLETHAPLQTRVGIATGLVVVGDLIGSGASQEQAIVGETPNLAARLQGIAEPNSVVIAESTRKLLGNLFELEDLGAQDLKGITGPVRAWAALRASSAEGRFEAMHAADLTALVGRDEEVELLMRRWARAKTIVALADEKGTWFWKAEGIMHKGWLFALTGKAADAVQKITSGLSAWRSSGAGVWIPLYQSCVARAHAELGQFADAWRCIGEAITLVETTKERWHEAEVHRLAGEIALMAPDPDAAKAEKYFERALIVARQQQAKSWELRAAMSLARLWRDQGKPQQARELLAPVYGWFTEGFDTRDLKEAKALLEELAA